jgi:prepilin-type N-terminal cleavage/methylation domain-containing protein
MTTHTQESKSVRKFVATRRASFSLLEILIVVVVIGILATMTLPRLMRKPPESEWKTVLDELNNLVTYGRQEAIANKKVYRLHFISNRTSGDTVQVEVEKDNPEKPGEKIFVTISSYYFKPIYKVPQEITIQGVYSGTKNEFEDSKGNAYCYIVPDGLVQEVTVQMDREIKGQKSSMKFMMIPFFGNFETHEKE